MNKNQLEATTVLQLAMCGTASQVILWRVQVSIEAFERRIDRYWRDQDIVYNYETALSVGHSDQDGNDISLDSSDNDLDMQV